MARKNNRICIVCGKNYFYCNSCAEGVNKPSWYAIFHDENCRKIYNACTATYDKEGKEAARVILDTCDLSNKVNLHHALVKKIDEIYASAKKDEKVEKNTEVKVEETKTETEDVKEEKKPVKMQPKSRVTKEKVEKVELTKEEK